MARYKGTGRHRVTEKERKRRAAKTRNKRRKKRQKAKTNFRLIRGLNRKERSKLRGKVSVAFFRYLDSKKPKTEEVEAKVKKSKKDDKVEIHGQYRSTIKKRKERRTEVKVLSSKRDRKKELEARIARQREKSRVRTENKRTGKEKLREALIEKRKAS